MFESLVVLMCALVGSEAGGRECMRNSCGDGVVVLMVEEGKTMGETMGERWGAMGVGVGDS